MTIAGSRLLRDGRVVFAGVGAPLEASVLAKRLHAPSLTIVLEGGSIGPRMLPGRLPVSTNEMRAAHEAFMLTSINDLFLYGQRGRYDYGFIGAGQLDQYGNVNTSYIGDPDQPKVRLPGSGGANDIVSSCREVMIMTRHEPRRFVERVDFITSPGYLSGPESRRGGRAGAQSAGGGHHRPGAAGLRRRDGPAAARRAPAGRHRGRRCTPTRASSCWCRTRSAELPPPTEQELAELRWLRDGEQSNSATRREVTSAP